MKAKEQRRDYSTILARAAGGILQPIDCDIHESNIYF